MLHFLIDNRTAGLPRLSIGMKMNAHFYDLTIRVLVYKEDDQFVAHALEFDILGYGETEAAAKKNLTILLDNQLSFAACKNSPESVYFPAPKEFFDRWDKANQAKIKGEKPSGGCPTLHGKSTVIVYSDEALKKLRVGHKGDFSKIENLVAA